MPVFNERPSDLSQGSVDEEQGDESTSLIKKRWTSPRGFLLIQVAIFSNVFLAGFDSTVTASTWAKIGSEYNAVNIASWLTTSYLITFTTFQPLYGRFSDIFGRRAGFFAAATTFGLGSLACSFAPSVQLFIAARLVQGVGGAGLMTMATIVNSDMIPFRERGMYQAAQNVTHGVGSICGASLGGLVADQVGWRWCFLLQVPISVAACVLGFFVLPNPEEGPGAPVSDSWQQLWEKVDFSGALLLIAGLSLQLVGLGLGGNDLPWLSPWVIASLLGSLVIMALFIRVEASTKAMPIMPLRMFRGISPVATQISNLFVGMAAYAFLFQVPLYFQAVLGESASKAGARLIVPSVASPLGGLISGIVMSRWGKLALLVRIGTGLMAIGNSLVASFRFREAGWKYIVFLFPANLGQGIVYPGILFTYMAAFDHTDHAVSSSTVYLVRSLGWVYGVAITQLITQNTLTSRLPAALSEVDDKRTIIDNIRHSVSYLHSLPVDVQVAARQVYHQGIQCSLIASVVFATVASIAALFSRGQALNREGL
ncbi:multidrug efflux transporter [Pseudovirgaria hyperparasitica]|uniref:Multidrug efflux transporter n=1 Tax=Pseudovirgaria hyperparasitica TaxID=470096 RepID=A0A6A6WAZ2_9PEZI|nr:multidrug efflux transporter [Pseudovirgaria hyperparasitica]KAF2759204.1 multidrug efflux transporter [Pseudovirgaria hyperparasitica]